MLGSTFVVNLRSRLWVRSGPCIALLLTLLMLTGGASVAFAGTADEINVLPVRDALNRSETTFSNGGKWGALSWDTSASGHNTGQDSASGWSPYDAFSTVNGAYWTPSAFSDKSGDAAALTMQTSPGITERYVSLWLDMPSPGTAKSGYQLRWTMTNASTNTYSLTLSKWSTGTQTTLASNASVTIAPGTTMAVSDTGGTLTAWQGSSGTLSSVLSAADTTFTGGYAGLEASGNSSRSTNFKAGSLIGGALGSAPVLDNLERSEVPFAAGGKWSKTSWAGSIGGAWSSPYRGYGGTGLSGAYWNPASFSDGGETVLTAATVGTGATPEGQYLSLWLDMPNPAAERSGYEARFTGTNGTSTAYKVELSKWVAGTRTVFASSTGFSLPVGTTMALTESAGGGLALWTGTGTMTPLLTATDSTYSSGYAGLEVNGGAGTMYNFKAGRLNIAQLPQTTISSGPKGNVLPNVSFAFTGTEGATSYECSLDASAYSACSAPASYTGLTEGAHNFKVRASGPTGKDESPAERSFQVLAPAKAETKVALLDNLERQEVPLATGKWTKTSWAAAIGGAWMGGYRGFGSSSGLAGAYWNPASFSDGGESQLIAATVGTGATPEGQYLALWLDMPNPASERSGYEVRFTGTNSTSTAYKAELSKWIAGTRTVLASSTGFSLPVGTTIVLGETAGGSLAVWTGTSTMTQALAARDTTFSSGYAGLEVNGGAGTMYNFRAGRLDLEAPNTTISSGPSGVVQPENVSFTFTSSETGSTFECSLDGVAYSACSSPKAYSGLASGSSHTFKVRALDAVGNQDQTPAERSFQVVLLPSAITTAATAVKPSEATLHASINPNGAETKYQFEYGTTTSYGSKAPATATSIGSGSTSVEASQPITGLTPGATYHFRISATNAAGTSRGEDRTFTTPMPPLATTETATGIGNKAATLNATVNPKGAETTYQFEYGTTTSYGSRVPASAKAIGSGMSALSVNEALTGLQEGTPFHFRVVATNEAGTSYGSDLVFSTTMPPVASTDAATSIEGTQAELHGTVNPNGSSTSYHFEYGTTTSYGSSEPLSPGNLGDATEAGDVEDGIEGLTPHTTYHYRLVATSSAGTATGGDQVFTTGESSAAEAGEEPWEGTGESGGGGGGTGGAYTSAVKNSVTPEGFVFGMHFSSQQQDEEPTERNAIYRYGAKMLRINFDAATGTPEEAVNRYRNLFTIYAERGITILPTLYTRFLPVTESEITNWKQGVKKLVETYGPGGTFWTSHSSLPNKPAVWWEVWNEPNRGWNSHDGHNVEPAKYGQFLEAMSEVISAASGSKAKTLLGGLLSIPTHTVTYLSGQKETVKSPTAFLNQMGHHSAYDAVAVHPYAFKWNGTSAPTEVKQVPGVVRQVKKNIKAVRNTLNGPPLNENGKALWIDELGWPTGKQGDYPEQGTFPPVTEEIQATELLKTFDMIKAYAKPLNIHSLFYFNARSYNDGEWDGFCGLRRVDGKWREATAAYEAETGEPVWPKKPGAFVKQVVPKARRASASASIVTEDVRTMYRYEYASNPSFTSPTFTQEKEAGYEGEVTVNDELTGLNPNTNYYLKLIATNENGQKTEVETQFKTELSTTTDTTIRQLNGETGWIDVSGHVYSSEGHSLTGDYVNINFWKNEGGTFVFKPEESTHAGVANNFYNLENWKIGKGEWKVQVVFEGFGEDLRSETPVHNITFENGYQLYNVNSGKCLEVAEKSYSNGAGIHQWECGDARTRQDQVFTLVPTGSGYNYELVARHSNMCLDVINAGQGAGTGVQQYECLGAGQTNQVWHGVPPVQNGSEPITLAAQHSGQCLDILSSATNNGANAVQNPCSGSGSQKWVLVPVEPNQVPLEAFETVDETLNGHPGYVTVHGNVKAGGYNLSGKWVNVNFERYENGGYVAYPDKTVHPVLSASGSYSYTYRALGSGDWRTRVVFPGEGPLEEDKSEYHPIHIGDGYRFKFRQSDKCVSTSEGKTGNGTAIIQWDCSGAPNPADGQVYSIAPVQPYGSSEFTIRPDSDTNKCLDVSGVNPANGTPLQLWDCLGESQGNQIWHIVPIAGQPPWFASIARFSGKCMDVLGQSLNNGARIDQWECWWGGNQQWQWQSIG
jgi:hypothetical protein